MQAWRKWRAGRKEKEKQTRVQEKSNNLKDRSHRDGDVGTQGGIREVAGSSGTGADSTPDDDHDESYGMHVLVPRPANQGAIVDIVAIHGLNGHYDLTWTCTTPSGKQVNWLKDFLPGQIPQCRIMSYGYNSAVQFSKSAADIGVFAEQLLFSLMAKRRSHIERERPAVVRAHERDFFGKLLQMIHGVAFFGTPHRGSSLAEWGTHFANILNIASFGTKTNSQLSADLEERSRILRSISKSFVDRGKNLDILSFYETEKAEWLNCRIVEETSAVLDLPNELAIPIDGNHRTICKFENDKERRYEVVWTNLQDMVEKVIAESPSVPLLSLQEQLDCARVFEKGSSYDSYRTVNPSRAPGTCKWLLEHDGYVSWRQKPGSAFLWISADAGCGKSVLSSFLVDQLSNEISELTQADIVCHFFLKDNSNQNDAKIALGAILYQIFTHSPDLLRHAWGPYKSRGQAIMDNFETLWGIFRAVVMENKRDTIFCVLDGLDECEETSKSDLMKSFVSLYERSRQGALLKTIITSRPDNSIKAAFGGLPRLKGEDEIEAISHDVALVIRHTVKELDIPEHLVERIETALIKGADRTHLWTDLVMRLLKDALINAVSESEITAILNSRDIYALYNHMLTRSSNPVQARKLLRLIIAARRPLTLREMNVAMATTPLHKTFASIESHLKYPPENYFFALCGHFIRVIRSNVHLVHQTAREFLLADSHAGLKCNDQNITESNAWQHSISLLQSNDVMLNICLSYLSMFGFSSDTDDTTMESGYLESNDFQKACDKRYFLKYAAEYWPSHFKNCDVEYESESSRLSLQLCHPSFAGFYLWLKPHLDMWGANRGQWKRLDEKDTQLRVLIRLKLENLALPLLHKKDVNVKLIDENGQTLLHLAVLTGSTQIVRTLLEQNALVNATDSSGSSPLQMSVDDPSKEAITRELLASNADVNQKDHAFRTALHVAAQDGGLGQIAQLLAHDGIDVNATDERGDKPIHIIRRRPTMDPVIVGKLCT